MLQRICDRCGKIIEADVRISCDELPSNMCLVHFSDGNIKRKVNDPSVTKQYELCLDCKDQVKEEFFYYLGLTMAKIQKSNDLRRRKQND